MTAAIGKGNAAPSTRSSLLDHTKSSLIGSTASGESVSRSRESNQLLPDWRADEWSGSLRILHVITDLNLGGAEVMLYRLLQPPQLAHYSPRVVSLTALGGVAAWLP